MDRIQVLCSTFRVDELPDVPVYKVEWDRFVRGQTPVRTYNRVRAYTESNIGDESFCSVRAKRAMAVAEAQFALTI